MTITNQSIDEFLVDFKLAMAKLQEKYGVTIEMGRITYNEDNFSGRLTVKNGQDPEEVARADFDRDVWRYEHLGLGPGMYKRVFVGGDKKRYAIVGFNTRAKKYPLKIVQIADGSTVMAGERFIKELLDEYYVENLSNGRISGGSLGTVTE